jgi:lysophospholipase L1-like esterase
MRNCLIMMLLVSTPVIATVAPDGAPMDENFHKCESLECGVYPAAKFRLRDKALSGATVYGETFFASEGSKFYRTVFHPSRVRYVFNPSTGEIYQPGRDYVPTAEGIKLTEASHITPAPSDFLTSMSDDDRSRYKVKVTTEVQKYQYAVTYDKAKSFAPKSFGTLGNLPGLIGKVPLKVTFFGDSITDGANATSTYAPPNQPGYAGLVMAYMNAEFPGMWEYRNNSVGGWSTLNAASAVTYRVMDKKSDLVVLAFGMNDSNYIPPAQYRDNLQKVITAIRSKQPRVPILLVSGTVANPSSSIQNRKFLLGYLDSLHQIVNQNALVKVADITTTWQMMLKSKRYNDITGNGLNHPNDFGHRVIAEGVLSALLGARY